MQSPLLVPLFPPGKEPLPPGMTEEDRANMMQVKKYQNYMTAGMESCVGKTTMAAAFGLAAGGFFSLMSSSFAYEDPLLRQNLGTTQKTMEIFKEMGRGMWRSGKGFSKVGALYAGIECVIESYRARHDLVNPAASGFVAGGILARNSGPSGVLGGGLAFAAFSTAIDLFLRREPADDD